MAKKDMKRPEYDGNACMLYDFMVFQGLTEEIIVRQMGLDEEFEKIWDKKVLKRAPWQPVATWIQNPGSIPLNYMLGLCSAMNAPVEAVFFKSRILNNLDFSFGGSIWQEEGRKLEDVPSAKLIEELRRRGYKVFKEV